MRPRRVTLAKLSGPHWADIIAQYDVRGMLERGELRTEDVSALDAFLKFSTDVHSQIINVDVLRSWSRAHSSPDKLSRLKRAFAALFEPSPAHLAIDQVRREVARKYTPPSGTYRRRARKFSVFPEELPPEWRSALGRMKLGDVGVDAAATAPSYVQTTETKLCEFTRACLGAGEAPNFSVGGLVIYERSLHSRARPLSPRTIKSSLRQLRDFAQYIGASQEVYTHLAGRLRFWGNRITRTPAQKEAKVLALPSYAEIFGIVFDLLGRSDEGDPLERQKFRNHAVAVALMCAFPLRLADTRLRFGHEILWDGRRYSFNILTSKTGAEFQPTLQPIFGWFVDQLVLQGSNSVFLEEMRAEAFRTERHLFVDYSGKPLHAGYVSYAWREVLGTGCHIARSKIHDEFAELGQEGVELAMTACTHRSQKTAEFYRSRAYELLMVRGAHGRIASQISEAEWRKYMGS